MISKLSNETTTRTHVNQSATFGDCCKNAPYIGGAVICIQHDKMHVFEVSDSEPFKCEIRFFPREKMNLVLSVYKNSRPCPKCGHFFSINNGHFTTMNSDPLQPCDDCDPRNVNLEDYWIKMIPNTSLEPCCDNPEIEPNHQIEGCLILECANCECNIFEDVDLLLLECVANQGKDSPLMNILFLSMVRQWNSYVKDQPSTIKTFLRD